MASPPIEEEPIVSVTIGADGTKIAAGSTIPGANWQAYRDPEDNKYSIYLDVDTSAAGFIITPIYVTSMSGGGHHWKTTGSSSVIFPTPTGFRVHVRWGRESETKTVLTPEMAKNEKWQINWIAFEPPTLLGDPPLMIFK